MSGAIALDRAWLAAHPLPVPSDDETKNSRGRVLSIGGSRTVPGALRLTGEAALRVGAGKVRLATIESAALSMGLLLPEAAVIGLPENGDGEIASLASAALDTIARVDTVLVGPGMTSRDAARRLVAAVAASLPDDAVLILDAAGVACAGPLLDRLRPLAGRLILTPHLGEMAALCECAETEVAAAPERIVVETAGRFGAALLLKGPHTLVASPDGVLVDYPGGGVGLATSGSGDVLAGAIAGLAARGAPIMDAAAWGVWLHGEAGRAVAARQARIGFLARDLLPELPGLLP